MAYGFKFVKQMLLIHFSGSGSIACVGEIEELRVKQKKLDKKRREALSKILDIKGNRVILY